MLALKVAGKVTAEEADEEMQKFITKVKTRAQPLDPTGHPVDQESKGRQRMMQLREKAYADAVMKDKKSK